MVHFPQISPEEPVDRVMKMDGEKGTPSVGERVLGEGCILRVGRTLEDGIRNTCFARAFRTVAPAIRCLRPP